MHLPPESRVIDMNKTTTIAALPKRKKSVGEWLADLSLPILLAALLAFFSVMTKSFFTPYNLTNILLQNVHLIIIACAVMIIMISGGCDLSIGYQMSVASVLLAKMLSNEQINTAVAVLAAILLCAVLGLFNGALTHLLKSNAMIVTLGTMAIFHGISSMISGNLTIAIKNRPGFEFLARGKLFGWLPLSVVIAAVIVLIVGFVMNRTVLGRKVYAAGDNPEAARLAGLNVVRIKILSFTVAGVLVGIAAVMLAARLSTASTSSSGPGCEFDGITACVLSGVALKGGEGTLWKVIVAVLALGVLANGMKIMNLGADPQEIVKGIIMLGSLYLINRNAKHS